MNGYFTASLNVKNVGKFLTDYQKNVLSFSQHARGHPPGIILFDYIVNNTFSIFPQLEHRVDAISPKRPDMKTLWQSLKWNQKLGAISLGFIIPLVSLIAIFPIYFLGKYLYGVRTGIRAAILYGFIPSVSLFNPLPDGLFAFFSILAIYLFVKGIKRMDYMPFFLAGLVLSIGIFFSLSLLPIILMLFLFSVISFWMKKNSYAPLRLLLFTAALIICPLSLFLLFNYNTLSVGETIVKGLAPRSYIIWLFFNIYDFFMFAGVPFLIIFLLSIKTQFRHIVSRSKKLDPFFLSFLPY